MTELIQGYTIAKSLETTETELIRTIFPHPTLSETIHEAVLDAYGSGFDPFLQETGSALFARALGSAVARATGLPSLLRTLGGAAWDVSHLHWTKKTVINNFIGV